MRIKSILSTSLLAWALTWGLSHEAGAATQGDAMTTLPVSSNPTAHGGRHISLYGTLSQIPHQHLLDTALKEHQIEYFSIDDGAQIVIYLPKPFAGFDCPGPLKLSGEVLQVRGSGKRPNQPVETDFVEHQLRVDSWYCLAPEGPQSWLRELGLSQATPERKQSLARQLVQSGKAAIPLLIEHLRDERLYLVRQEMPASAINAPVNTPLPAPLNLKISVGQAAEELLYEIITPVYASPHASRGKPYSRSIFHVRDWPGWWQAHQYESLEEIHASLRPRVDRYWLGHGSVQELD